MGTLQLAEHAKAERRAAERDANLRRLFWLDRIDRFYAAADSRQETNQRTTA